LLIFFHPLVVCAHSEGVPWELGIGARGQETRMIDGLLELRKKSDDIFSCLDTIHECDRQTDGHRTTAKTALTQGVAR